MSETLLGLRLCDQSKLSAFVRQPESASEYRKGAELVRAQKSCATVLPRVKTIMSTYHNKPLQRLTQVKLLRRVARAGQKLLHSDRRKVLHEVSRFDS